MKIDRTDFYHQKRQRSLKLADVKARRIKKVLDQCLMTEPIFLLDDGCGTGEITKKLSELLNCNSVGIDIVKEDVKKSVENGVEALLADGIKLPFLSKSFDIVLSYQVIEHVSDKRRYLNEIHRVLKDDGVVYLTCPNKYYPIEQHYLLPFLSYLPYNLANVYLKITKRGSSFEHIKLLSHEQILSLLNEKFRVEDFTTAVISNPYEYELDKEIGESLCRILTKLNNPILTFVKKFVPKIASSFIFVAWKK